MKKIADFLLLTYKQPKLYLPFLGGLFINFLMWLLIVLRMPATSTWIPLHYSSYFGIDWIGPWLHIIYYPAVCLAIILINFVFGALENNKNPQLTIWLAWFSFIIQLVVLISLIFLIIHYYS